MFLGSFIPGAQFISFTKVNPGHRQYCGCDAHEYGARWIPLAPWQEVGSGLTQQSYQRPDKSESHEAYENQMLSVVFDDFFWACHNLNIFKYTKKQHLKMSEASVTLLYLGMYQIFHCNVGLPAGVYVYNPVRTVYTLEN